MNHTNLAFLGGWAVGRGVYIPRNRSSVSSFAFQKLLGEIEAEFVQNLKGLIDFEVQTWITKKSRVDAEALASIHASIHRSHVSPTALLYSISCSRIGSSIVEMNKSLTDTWMWKLGLWPHNSFSGIFCFEFRFWFFALQRIDTYPRRRHLPILNHAWYLWWRLLAYIYDRSILNYCSQKLPAKQPLQAVRTVHHGANHACRATLL